MKKIILTIILFAGLLPQIDGDIVLSLFPCGNVAFAADPVPTELYHCEDEFGLYVSSFPCDKTPGTEACSYCGSPKIYDEESDEFYCPNMSWCDKCNAWKHIDEHDHNEEDEDDEEDEDNGGGGYGGNSSNAKLTTNQLINAAREAFLLISRQHPQGAYCNIGVQTAFKNAFGHNNDGIFGKNANGMLEYMNSSSKWHSISLSEVNAYANRGYFVVTGWYNLDGGSGHINLVLPGYSGIEFRDIHVMDTGSYRGYDDTNNYHYGANKRNNVEYFYYE